LISAIGSAFINDLFCFFRFIGGIGVEASSTAPTYISDRSARIEGSGSILSIQYCLGILVAFLSNYLLKDIGENSWRWMVEAFPSDIYNCSFMLKSKMVV
jgi:MFS family permease